MKLEGKKVLVVGAGKSGIAASELLLDKKIETVLYDGNKDLDVEKLYEKAPKLKGMPVLLGELTDEQLRAFDVAVLSPGVPTDLPVVERMRAQNVCIWGEIELAYSFAKGRLIAITGTNGKTTTTALTGEIMKNYFKDVRVVGNIGIPYTSEAATMTDETVTVAEISSFQLETIHEFHPQISAILNITPDHLNRHHTMECYIRTKEAITTNQTNDEVCVLNYEDEVLRAFGESAPVHVVWFSSARKLAEGFYLDGEEIFYAHDGSTCHECEFRSADGENRGGAEAFPGGRTPDRVCDRKKRGPFLQRFQGDQPGCRHSGNPCDEPSNASDRRRL